MTEPRTNLRVKISADLADIKSGLVSLRDELSKVKKQTADAMPTAGAKAFTESIATLRKTLIGLGVGIIAFREVMVGIRTIATATIESEKAVTLLNAKLRSLGSSAIASAPEIKVLAESLQSITTFDDEAITNAATSLLNFTNIDPSHFGRTLKASLDLAASSGDDLSVTVDKLGKALNDPEKGLRLLRDAGIALGDQQVKLISHLIDTGDRAKAQSILLGELERRYQGAAVAARSTLGGALSGLKNSFENLLEGDGGNIQGVTSAINELTDTMNSPAVKSQVQAMVQSLASFASDAIKSLAKVASYVLNLLENLKTLAVFLGTRLALVAIPAVVAGFAALRNAIIAARTATLTLEGAMALLGGPIGIAIAALAAGMYFLYQRTSQAKVAAEEHAKAMQANANMAAVSKQAALDDAVAKRKQALATLEAARAALAQAKIQADIQNKSVGARAGFGGLDKRGGGGAALAANTVQQGVQSRFDQAQSDLDAWTKRLVDLSIEVTNAPLEVPSAIAAAAAGTKEAIKGIVDQADLARDAIARQLKALEQLFEDGKVKLADYYAQKRDLQLQDIDAQIAQQQEEARTAKSSDQQSKALTEIVKLQRERAEIGPAVAREQAAAEEKFTKALEDVRLRMLEANGQTAEAARAKLESEFKDLLDWLREKGRNAEAAAIDGFIDSSVIKQKVEEFKTQVQQIMADLQGSETSLGAQASGGLMGGVEAERKINEQRTLALDKLRALRESTLQYYETTKDPSVLAFLQELNGNIGQVVDSQQAFKHEAQDSAIGALTGFLADLSTGVKSFKAAFIDMVRSFIQGLAQMAAKALATRAMLALFNAFAPSANNFGVPLPGSGTLPGFTAGVQHLGGIIGGGTLRANMSPLLFGEAPRYHQGGIAGLGPDEIPAILQRGEEVLAKNNPRHVRNQRGNKPTSQRFIFVDDARKVGDYLNTPEGEEAVVQLIGRNPGAIREILG